MQIAQLLTISRERELEKGIDRRASRKLAKCVLCKELEIVDMQSLMCILPEYLTFGRVHRNKAPDYCCITGTRSWQAGSSLLQRFLRQPAEIGSLDNASSTAVHQSAVKLVNRLNDCDGLGWRMSTSHLGDIQPAFQCVGCTTVASAGGKESPLTMSEDYVSLSGDAIHILHLLVGCSTQC